MGFAIKLDNNLQIVLFDIFDGNDDDVESESFGSITDENDATSDIK